MRDVCKGYNFSCLLIVMMLISGFLPAQATEQSPSIGNDDTYQLIGTVTGLSGELVVGLLDDGETVKITGEGSFEFKKKFRSGEKYAVKIKTPAANHLCEMANGQGTITADDQPQIDIVCRQTGRWEHPRSLADSISPDGQNAKNPVAAINDSGNAVIVWSQFDGKFWRIYKSEFRDKKWRHPSSLTDAISLENSDAIYPQIAISDNGDIVIAWVQVFGKISRIYMAELRKGKWNFPKSTADFISIGEDKHAWNIDLAMDNLGNTIVAWTQETSQDTYRIFKSEYRDGKWQHPGSLENAISVASDKSIALSPKIAMNNHGMAIISWQQSINRQNMIYLSEFRNDTWRHPRSIDDHINPTASIRSDAYNPVPVLSESDTALIAWEQSVGQNRGIFLSKFDGKRWTHPNLNDSISPMVDDNFATLNSVVMDSAGNAMVLWGKREGAGQVLYLGSLKVGQWHQPAEIVTITGTDINYFVNTFAKAAMADSGKAVVAWQHHRSDGINRVMLAEFDHGMWYLPGKQNSLLDNQAGNVNVSSAKSGRVLVVWEQSDGKYGQIYKSEFHRIKQPEKKE